MSEPNTHSTISTRAKWIYGALTFMNILLTCMVFWDAVYSRLAFGEWRRGKYLYVNTLSLDIHATIGAIFILVISAQFVLGYFAVRSKATSIHRMIGRGLLYCVLPLFMMSALWASVDRSANIPPEKSVIFKHNVPLLVFFLVTLLLMAGYFLVVSAHAIRRGDVSLHLDTMVAAITMFAGIVWIRFLYILYWKLIGPTPFTIMGMAMNTAIIVSAMLIGAYALAGRLAANRQGIIVLLAWVALFLIGLQPFYDYFDPKSY